MPFGRGPTTPGLGDLLTILLVVSTPRMSWDPPSRRGVTRLWISCRGDRQTTKFWDPIILRLRENMNYWHKNNIYIYVYSLFVPTTLANFQEPLLLRLSLAKKNTQKPGRREVKKVQRLAFFYPRAMMSSKLLAAQLIIQQSIKHWRRT